MMRLELSGLIEGDLEEIAGYIARESPRKAVSFIRDIRTKFHDIGRNPLLYQLRPDIGESARLVTVERYVILFRVVGDVVRIERVVYGGRDLPTVMEAL